MAIFDPMFVIPSDLGSFSVYLNAHYLEHLQLVQVAQAAFPTATIQVYDIGVWPRKRGQYGFGDLDLSEGSNWIDAHQAMTESISALYGLELPDLTQVDPEDEESWRQWEGDNAQWHIAARAAAGIA